MRGLLLNKTGLTLPCLDWDPWGTAMGMERTKSACRLKKLKPRTCQAPSSGCLAGRVVRCTRSGPALSRCGVRLPLAIAASLWLLPASTMFAQSGQQQPGSVGPGELQLVEGLLEAVRANGSDLPNYTVKEIALTWYSWEPIRLDTWPSDQTAAHVRNVLHLKKGPVRRYVAHGRSTGHGDAVHLRVTTALMPKRRLVVDEDGDVYGIGATLPTNKERRRRQQPEIRLQLMGDVRTGAVYFRKSVLPRGPRHRGEEQVRYVATLIDPSQAFSAYSWLAQLPRSFQPFARPAGAIAQLERAVQQGTPLNVAVGVEYRHHKCVVVAWRTEESHPSRGPFTPATRAVAQWRVYLDLCCPGMVRAVERVLETMPPEGTGGPTRVSKSTHVVQKSSRVEGAWIAWDIKETLHQTVVTPGGEELTWWEAHETKTVSLSFEPPSDDAMALHLPPKTLVECAAMDRPGRYLLRDGMRLTPANFAPWYRDMWHRLAAPPTVARGARQAADHSTQLQPGLKILLAILLLTLAIVAWFLGAAVRARRARENS